MESAVEFYEAVGFDVDRYDDGFAFVNWEHQNVFDLDLLPGTDPARNGAGCYVIVSEVDEWHRRLVAAGLPVTEPADMPWGMHEFTLTNPSMATTSGSASRRARTPRLANAAANARARTRPQQMDGVAQPRRPSPCVCPTAPAVAGRLESDPDHAASTKPAAEAPAARSRRRCAGCRAGGARSDASSLRLAGA